MLNAIEADQPYKPIREGLFQIDPPRLLGSQCPACRTKVYPAKGFCPQCDGDGAERPHVVPLSPEGVVFAYTVIHQAPAGRKTPYVLAYVDLDDEVRVLAQIHAPHTDIRIGQRVALALCAVGTEDGKPVIGYAFVLVDQSRGA